MKFCPLSCGIMTFRGIAVKGRLHRGNGISFLFECLNIPPSSLLTLDPCSNKSLTGPEMNTESFLSLRTFKKFFVFLSLVKVFFSFSEFCIFFFIVLCQLQAVSISACNREPLHNRDDPGGIQYLCSLSAGVLKMGTIWGR